jgi:hypothetical protein
MKRSAVKTHIAPVVAISCLVGCSLAGETPTESVTSDGVQYVPFDGKVFTQFPEAELTASSSAEKSDPPVLEERTRELASELCHELGAKSEGLKCVSF